MRKLKNKELNRLSVEDFKKSTKNSIVVILDNIRSLNNVGSFFRTSDAFSIEEICLCGITPTPPHNDIHKTALGAEESVKWNYFSDCALAIERLKKEGFRIYSVEQAEESISLLDYKPLKGEKVALVFGNEVKGVQQSIVNMSDGCIEIPQYGTKHSLNVSISAGIVLWEVFRQKITS
ncbi:RNA methyltransferase [bacterium]|nr:RNA methyltransferase [bacterium]